MNSTLRNYKGDIIGGLYRHIKEESIFIKVNKIEDDEVHFSYVRQPHFGATTRQLDYFKNNYKLVD